MPFGHDDLNDARQEAAWVRELALDPDVFEVAYVREARQRCVIHDGTYTGQEGFSRYLPGTWLPKREPICDLVAAGIATEGECDFPEGIDP